jgi:hypothetical protein
LRVCQRCHDLAELKPIRGEDGLLMPKLPLGVCLTVKKVREPSEWNPERLTELYHRNLPDLLPIPHVFAVAYSNRIFGH